MTCIVGIAEGGHVWIGGDSAGVSGWKSRVRTDPKVFERGPFVMGFTTSFRMGQLLCHSLETPCQPSEQTDLSFLVTTFADAVRNCLKRGGFAKRESEVESGGVFLLGYRGRLFRVDSDYQIVETADQFDAVGCGDEVALGALHANSDRLPAERILEALGAAERFNAAVRGPFTVVHQEGGRR